ncbi:MAG: hypothetical protein GOV15_01835, partial [Candidatus Diapherotrites archaeon]|nr:hypothetical protein [Candidatus Diapherotrites archaeon]
AAEMQVQESGLGAEEKAKGFGRSEFEKALSAYHQGAFGDLIKSFRDLGVLPSHVLDEMRKAALSGELERVDSFTELANTYLSVDDLKREKELHEQAMEHYFDDRNPFPEELLPDLPEQIKAKVDELESFHDDRLSNAMAVLDSADHSKKIAQMSASLGKALDTQLWQLLDSGRDQSDPEVVKLSKSLTDREKNFNEKKQETEEKIKLADQYQAEAAGFEAKIESLRRNPARWFDDDQVNDVLNQHQDRILELTDQIERIDAVRKRMTRDLHLHR